MTLEGAQKFNEDNNYIIYTMNSVNTGQYCIILPKSENQVMNMLVDLHKKELFDKVSSGGVSREELIKDLSDEYSNISHKYNNAIVVFPMLDDIRLKEVIQNNDKQKMIDEVKKISGITSEVYRKLIESGVSKQNINGKIIIIEKNEEDKKFVSWLREQNPEFVDGILYNELIDNTSINLFMNNSVNDNVSNNSSIFDNNNLNSTTPSATAPAPSIFDNLSVNESNPVNEVVQPVSNNMDIFSNNTAMQNTNNPADGNGISFFEQEQSVSNNNVNTPTNVNAPVNNEVQNGSATQNSGVDFASPLSSAINNQPQQTQNIASPAPQPVNNVALEGTTTFSPISNESATNNVVNNGENTDAEQTSKGSKGFVNLIILVVILVGVTIVSIELGKFLYNVYGA